MSITVRDLFKGSLRLIRAIATGENPSAEELNDGIAVINELFDLWSTEDLMIFDKITETFPLTANQQTYTMGTGGNFNTARPVDIEEAGLLTQVAIPAVEIPLEIINQKQWAAIALKSTTSTVPSRLYMEDSFPLAKINLWPIPNAVSSLTLYSSKPLTGFTSGNDVVSLPPAYQMAIRFNWAMALAPEYGKQPDAIVSSGAISSKANIKRINNKPQYLNCDPSLLARRRSFNWRTGG